MASRGIRNNNPGNIRHSATQWKGMAPFQRDPEFVTFVSPEWGIRAMAITIRTYVEKRKAPDGSPVDTIVEIISRWAPAAENNTRAYIRAVDDDHPKTAWDVLDPRSHADMDPLIRGIIHHENGEQPYPQSVIDAGLKLAGVTAL